ncbi:hypothetical protein IAE35_06350 [Pseudomonas sp. S75]|uniref:Ig-like domain-containing protein n=1 Tax=unclassified Pseudomonas TaxID=196821 RepID=UPI0019072806|nr:MULTISPECIES: hypothetical protein [unclassified Pseudomonas]MBJ9975118.1 hypothetical protein [Pseudomonas sp. S30]MBK0152955.1 hypothetical protein [Pseudomonas sp. S75]
MNDLTLPAMSIVDDGKLDPSKIPSSGAPVIMTIPGAHAGSRLNLMLQAQRTAQPLYTSPSLPIGASGRPITLRIPRQHFVDHLGEALQVLYSVSSVGTSAALTFDVDQGFSGEQRIDLSKHLYKPLYVNGQVRLPKSLPSYAFYDRALPGASAYRSSDPSVATVDGKGRVTLMRNGQSTITADLPGGPQSYVLTVSGISGLEVLSAQPVDWQSAKNLCDAMGMAMPQERDFRFIIDAYGVELSRVLDARAPLWGASVGGNTALTLDPIKLTVTSEAVQPNKLRQVIGID